MFAVPFLLTAKGGATGFQAETWDKVGAIAARGIVERARLRFGEHDQVLHRLHGHRGMHDQRIRRGYDERDRREVFLDAERKLRKEAWIDDERLAIDEQRL